MSFVGSMLGLGGGGGAGLNWQAQKTPVLQAVNTPLTDTYQGIVGQGINEQQAFVNAVKGQGGLSNQNSVFNQQQNLANQYQNLANGVGPNPALAQLANTTGANVANQGALMAGQRGSNANVGLLARQIAQQGAATQQQAVGQGAVLQAQQQLNAMGALQQQQGMLGNLATQQVGQQANSILGLNQAAQSEQQNLLNALSQYNNANVNMQSNVNNANAGLAQTSAQGQQGLLGGVLGGVGSVMAFSEGGLIPSMKHYDEGGAVMNGPASNAGRFLYGSAPSSNNTADPNSFAGMGSSSQPNAGASALNSGMNSLVSAIGMKKGGAVVPGKASVKGDSLKNDKVPAMLSPGEVIIPRSIMQSGNPIENAAKFVSAVLAKNGMRSPAR